MCKNAECAECDECDESEHGCDRMSPFDTDTALTRITLARMNHKSWQNVYYRY